MYMAPHPERVFRQLVHLLQRVNAYVRYITDFTRAVRQYTLDFLYVFILIIIKSFLSTN